MVDGRAYRGLEGWITFLVVTGRLEPRHRDGEADGTDEGYFSIGAWGLAADVIGGAADARLKPGRLCGPNSSLEAQTSNAIRLAALVEIQGDLDPHEYRTGFPRSRRRDPYIYILILIRCQVV